MDFFKQLARKINSNVILRNVVLAACALIIFIFIVYIALNMFTRHGQVKEVPDLSGLTVEEARKESRNSHLRIEIYDSIYSPQLKGGVIIEQNPPPGSKVKSGRRMLVTINSFAQRKAVVPYVTGYSLRQAKNNLEVAGFQIDRLVYRADMAAGLVLEERYGDKTILSGSKLEAEIGSGITLVVGLGEAKPHPAPRIAGFTLREAKSRIWEAGFNVGTITRADDITMMTEKDAKVSLQSPSVGTYLTPGANIDLTITLDEEEIEKGITAADRAARSAARATADSIRREAADAAE